MKYSVGVGLYQRGRLLIAADNLSRADLQGGVLMLTRVLKDGARRLSIAAAVAMALGGCATLTIVPAERLAGQRLTEGAEPVAHIYAANWGIYLFKYIPIATGSLSHPGVPRWPTWFSDEVQIENLVQKVSEESKRLGGTVLTDLRTRDRSYWMGNWLLTWPFWLNEFEVSANTSGKTGSAETPPGEQAFRPGALSVSDCCAGIQDDRHSMGERPELAWPILYPDFTQESVRPLGPP